MQLFLTISFVFLSSYFGNVCGGILRNVSAFHGRVPRAWNSTPVLDWKGWLGVIAIAAISPLSKILVAEFALYSLLLFQKPCPIWYYLFPMLISIAIHYAALSPWCVGEKDWLWLGVMPGIFLIPLIAMSWPVTESDLLNWLWITSLSVGIFYLLSLVRVDAVARSVR